MKISQISRKTLRSKLCKGLLITMTLSLLGGSALAGPGDGTVGDTTKIVNNGPASDRFNLVLLGDGYTTDEQGKFAEDAQDFVDFLFNTPPFNTNCSAINVYRIDVESNESGADDPTSADADECVGATGATAATYFDSTFCADGVIRRLLGANNATAVSVLNTEIPEWDQALIIVNSSTYGGSGGTVGVTSVSGTWQNIAIHEFGHAAFGLADEYEYWAGCGSGEMGHDVHPMAEPTQPNVTIESDENLVKWKDLFFSGINIPTTMNDDCSQCDDSLNPFPGEQRVGLYEGAHYYHCSAYRPVFSCMMRNFADFCPVCTARILDTLEAYQPENTPPVCDAGGPYVAECTGTSTEVVLDGSGSSDVDCDPLTYAWSDSFTDIEVPEDDATKAIVHYAGVGESTVDLAVTDNEGAESTCSAQVTIQDTIPPEIVAPGDITVECAGPEGIPADEVDLGEPTVSDSCDGSPMVENDAPDIFPIGTTEVTWTATDASGNSTMDTQVVDVVDTTPPTISVDLSPDTLFPPNHKLVEISAEIAVEDLCDPDPEVELVSIMSNEPDDGIGDGATTGDIQAEIGTDDREFELRAERQGPGDSRVYTVEYSATDDSGNASTATDIVTVPHDRRK
jgi:hypothetical protein